MIRRAGLKLKFKPHPRGSHRSRNFQSLNVQRPREYGQGVLILSGLGLLAGGVGVWNYSMPIFNDSPALQESTKVLKDRGETTTLERKHKSNEDTLSSLVWGSN